MAEPVPATFTVEPCDYARVRTLMAALDLAEPVAVTLVRRGHDTVESARAFLAADEEHDPFEFGPMAEVVERVRAAIAAGRRITVHGDYDVDGVCSTAILVGALRRLGAVCDWLIPDRMGDGYGLSGEAVERLVERGTGLLVTVDCGITSVAEVAAAREAGIEVIVTDHHQPGSELPACPILHSAISGYPFTELCGTGVAYKLAVALGGEEAAAADLDLVALATVADLVPLRGENRALVRRGLAEARRARRPGMRALLASAKVEPERLDEGDFAFRLGPRINAAGRLYRADAGVELMLTDDPDRAEQIAAELERANHERREVERDVLRGAEHALAEMPPEAREAAGLVIAGEGWHPGVVGIVASRLAERLWRPVVLVAVDTEGRGRGSGRSVPGFDLLAALDRCAEHLTRYGGHRAAAGVELEAGELEAFRAAFAAACTDGAPAGGLKRSDQVDAIVGAEDLGIDVAEQFTRLGPFGLGNPGVRLLVPGAQLTDIRPMGEGDRHARFTLLSGAQRALGVAFGVDGSLARATAAPHDVSVALEINHWNGAVEPRVVLGSVYPGAEDDPEAESGLPHPIGDEEFWTRFDAELARDLGADPAAAPPAEREIVDRRGRAIVPALAGLAAGGGSLLVLCADAPRRRELVERAARPARFGGGRMAICSARLADDSALEARLLADAECGVVLADWGALSRLPSLAAGFAHVLVVDPASSSSLDAAAAAGTGYLHRLDGQAEAEFAIRCHTDEWPSRASLAELYRSLTAAASDLSGPRLRSLFAGERRAHPHAPESAARAARVLDELGLIAWEGCGAARALRVVSSDGTDLERSGAYQAYRERYEEGRRYLSQRRQPRPTRG